MSQILTVAITAPEVIFDADALRRAAFARAVSAGEEGVCLVLVQTLSASPVQVVVNTAEKEASIVLPVPKEERSLAFGTAFVFPGWTYLVTEEDPEQILYAARAELPETSPLCIVYLERETACISAMHYDDDGEKLVPVLRSAEAAAAAAMVLHRDLTDGTMESTIGQPGGILEIGLRKQGGKVTGLSAGGPVEYAQP